MENGGLFIIYCNPSSCLSSGKLDESTINFDINLTNFRLDRQRNLSKIDNLRIVVKSLASNKDIKKQANMMRLLFAGGIEFIKYVGGENDSSSSQVK
jgi:hypothetical protein